MVITMADIKAKRLVTLLKQKEAHQLQYELQQMMLQQQIDSLTPVETPTE